MYYLLFQLRRFEADVLLATGRTMVTQLIEHERIQTTLPKAKELRKVADRVVTYAKKVSK